MAVYACYPPGWMLGFWRLVRPLMPKRFVEKVDMIAPKNNPAELNRLRRAISLAHLPARFGGSAAWPPSSGMEGLVL